MKLVTTAGASGPILCVGAAHWDVIARISGPTPPGGDAPGRVSFRPGGVALNVAAALAALGLPTGLIAVVGRDAEGDRLIAAIGALGIDGSRVLRAEAATDCYVAIEAAGELVAAVADCRALEAAADALLTSMRARPRAAATVLDGNLPASLLDAIAAERLFPDARLYAVPASPAKANRLFGCIRAAAPTVAANRAEAEALCGATFDAAEPAACALVVLGARRALVTDGSRPAAFAGRGAACVARLPARLDPTSVTGAGDALLAALIAADLGGETDPALLLAAALDAAAAHITREAP